MKLIYKNLPLNKINNCIVTVGVFDGVHLGHQYLLEKIKREAKKKKKPSLVISFNVPPEKVLHPQNKFKGYLTDYQQKVDFMKHLGIDYLWLLKTELNILQFSADDFLSYINNYFSIDEMIVGSDFRFGTKAKAGVRRLEKAANNYGFKLKLVNKKKFYGKLVSSSFIGRLIKSSAVSQAKKFLGRNYTIKGQVKKGKGLGRQLGFPTANLGTFDYVLPGPGVYAAYSRIKGKKILSAVNIGEEGCEVHLINFSKNILGQIIEISFLAKIRNELVFKSKLKLTQQIQKDIKNITSKYSIPAN